MIRDRVMAVWIGLGYWVSTWAGQDDAVPGGAYPCCAWTKVAVCVRRRGC